MSWARRQNTDGPIVRFVYLWSGRWPESYTLDFSGTNCTKKITWDRVAEVHTLDRGQYKRYQKGHQIRITLSWGQDALFPPQFWDVDNYWGRSEKILRLMYNTTCHQQIFIWPWPGSHPANYYDVIWEDGFDFNYIKGLEKMGFQGELKLIGKTIYDEIPFLDYSQFYGGAHQCDPVTI